jgi:hypothetical protein
LEEIVMNTDQKMDLADEIMDLGKVSEETKGTVVGAENILNPFKAEPG